MSRKALLIAYREVNRIRREQEDQIGWLKARLARLHPLEPLLSVCSVCGKIRDEDGRWHSLESYITTRTGSKFTHGYCPECSDRVFREVQPIKSVCEHCGGALEVTRYVIEGRHFRRYSCPGCGYSQDYVRERVDKPG